MRYCAVAGRPGKRPAIPAIAKPGPAEGRQAKPVEGLWRRTLSRPAYSLGTHVAYFAQSHVDNLRDAARVTFCGVTECLPGD